MGWNCSVVEFSMEQEVLRVHVVRAHIMTLTINKTGKVD